MTSFGIGKKVDAPMWRRQCARNLMDCYAAGMEALNGAWEKESPGHAALESLTRLMVEGMTSVRDADDEKAFYRLAAGACRECAAAVGGKAGLFRVYAAIFEDLGFNGSAHAAPGDQEVTREERP